MFDLFFWFVRALTQLNQESELRNKDRRRRNVSKRVNKDRERGDGVEKRRKQERNRIGGGEKEETD